MSFGSDDSQPHQEGRDNHCGKGDQAHTELDSAGEEGHQAPNEGDEDQARGPEEAINHKWRYAWTAGEKDWQSIHKNRFTGKTYSSTSRHE